MKNSINSYTPLRSYARRSTLVALLLAGTGFAGMPCATAADTALVNQASVVAIDAADTLTTDALVRRLVMVRQQFQDTAGEDVRETAIRLSQILDARATAGDATAALYLGLIKKDECLTFGKDIATNTATDVTSCMSAAKVLMKRAVSLGDPLATAQLESLIELDASTTFAVADGGDGTGGRRLQMNHTTPTTSLSK